MPFFKNAILLCTIIVGLLATACKSSDPTTPAPDKEYVQCVTSIDGGTNHDGSALIFATTPKSAAPSSENGFIVLGSATTDFNPKIRFDNGIVIVIRPAGVGTYPVSYPLGSIFSVYYKGVAYISLQGSITVTRYDAVGGWVQGTFEGTANSEDGTKTITVTKGVFTVKRDPDGALG